MTANIILNQAAQQLAKRTGETLQSAANSIERAARAAGIDTERIDGLAHFILRTFGVADYTSAGADFSAASQPPTTRGKDLLALHKTGHGFPIEVLDAQATRADFTELAKAIAHDRGISFDAAVNAVITEAPSLLED